MLVSLAFLLWGLAMLSSRALGLRFAFQRGPHLCNVLGRSFRFGFAERFCRWELFVRLAHALVLAGVDELRQ